MLLRFLAIDQNNQVEDLIKPNLLTQQANDQPKH